MTAASTREQSANSKVEELAYACFNEYQSGRPYDPTPLCQGDEKLLAEVRKALDALLKLDPSRLFPPMPLHERFGRYAVIGEIGQGGMGTVYRVHDPELGRDLAVKLLRQDIPVQSTAGRRFVDEARITAQLQHPAIPAIHELGFTPDGRPWLAMKLIKGRTLDAIVKDPSVLIDRLAVFEAICQGLGYAHSRGVVHRDLKPSNVMVGAFGEVQVMDWGLAKLLDKTRRDQVEDAGETVISTNPEEDATAAGSIKGTPQYMAPEQAIGAIDAINERTDVFGLGGILCFLLTGLPPYRGTNSESVRQKAARADLADALERIEKADTEPETIALCRRCLQADASERFANASEVASEIKRIRRETEAKSRQTEVQRALADTKREIMTRRFSEFVFDFERRLRPIPGTQVFREELLQSAKKGLFDLIDDSGLSSSATALVWAHLFLGDIHYEHGEREAAMMDYRACYNVAFLQYYQDQTNADKIRNFAIGMHKRGTEEMLQNRLESALEH